MDEEEEEDIPEVKLVVVQRRMVVVQRRKERGISVESGIRSTRELGKYLGMPVLQRRINKDTFGEVIQRVSSRLAGWKSKTLSFAGRITLTRSVLSSIPVHTMSTVMLPTTTLDTLDKLSRDFLWGSAPERRKIHLVAWDRVCLPKSEGSLGIRKSKEMNMALIAKVGWRVLYDIDSLWARVVRCKYKVGDMQSRDWMLKKGVWSSTWRSVGIGLRGVVTKGTRWVIGDGRSVKFWQDKWLAETALQLSTIAELPPGHENLMVRDLWIEGRGWNLVRIAPFVAEDIQLELMALVIDSITGAKDRLSWQGTANGSFTVKSAYSLLTSMEWPRQNMGEFYKRIWKVMAPERVRSFLWLVAHQSIMTNSERFRRHMGDSSICPICKSREETIMHVLRDCPAISGIWNRLVPLHRRQQFFSQSLFQWLFQNLSECVQVNEAPWASVFAIVIWWAWKWRCGNVLGDNRLCKDRVRFVKDRVAEVCKANRALGSTTTNKGREERLIGWVAPRDDWIKINTDGASRGNPGAATAGGALRNKYGEWRGGFALNIGRCTATMAELWGVYYGLVLAWEQRFMRVVLEVDSEIVVGFLKKGIEETHPLSFLVRLCHGLLAKDWIVQIDHVYREANCLADGLANYAFTLPLGIHTFVSSPPEVVSILEDDVLGVSCPRQFVVP